MKLNTNSVKLLPRKLEPTKSHTSSLTMEEPLGRHIIFLILILKENGFIFSPRYPHPEVNVNDTVKFDLT